MEKSGTIAGHKWYAERFRPCSMKLAVQGVTSLEQLRKYIFPVAQDKLLSLFQNELVGGKHFGIAGGQPIKVGVFLFDPGTPGTDPALAGYRKPNSAMGNYMAEQDVIKDKDPMEIAERAFNAVADGLKDDTDNLDAKGIGLQFSYFSPLNVNIGLEFALRVEPLDD